MPYTKTQILYHWLTVLLLLILATTGMAYFYEVADDIAMVVHQITGQLLIGVLVLRLITRLRHSPPPATGHAPWERRLAGLTHVALYLTLIVFTASGYVAASAFGDPLLIAPISKTVARSDLGETITIVHYTAKWVLLGLVSLHILGALKHHLIDRDATLSRMTTSKPTGET